MSDSYLTNPLVFLVQTLLGLYAGILLIRFLLQWLKADFYNPVSQFVVKVTTPVLRPLRGVVPGYAGLDLSSLLAAWLVKALEILLIGLIVAGEPLLWTAFAGAIPELTGLAIDIFLFGILFRVILSWVNPDPYNPAVRLLSSLTDPLLLPAQRLLPPIGGLDLSPMLVMIGLVLLKMLLLPILYLLTGTQPF